MVINNDFIGRYKSNIAATKRHIIIDYYMTFFILHVISTRDIHISPRAKGPSGYYGSKVDMACNMKNAIS
jgi:hypothetical protein